jgi:hypothetical protein
VQALFPRILGHQRQIIRCSLHALPPQIADQITEDGGNVFENATGTTKETEIRSRDSWGYGPVGSHEIPDGEIMSKETRECHYGTTVYIHC